MTVLQRLPVWLGDALPHEDKDGMTMNEEHSQAKNRAALVSLLAACLLTAIKLVVGIYTNSLGILSEALHSGLDLLAAAMTLYAVRLSSRPADARHPYGHGKVENLSALGETVLLFVICVWVVYEGAGRLLSGDTPVAPSIWGIIVMGISIVIDVNRVRVLKKSPRRHGARHWKPTPCIFRQTSCLLLSSSWGWGPSGWPPSCSCLNRYTRSWYRRIPLPPSWWP